MVGVLLDTNVISDLWPPRSVPRVAATVESIPPELLYISVLTAGELVRGIDALPSGRRRLLLQSELEQFLEQYDQRFIPISQEIAMLWGRLAADAKSKGFQLATIDGLIAATALHHDLSVMTRNVRDFEVTGVRVINPWDDQE